MKPRLHELADGTLVAYLTAQGQLTTKERAAYAVLNHPDGRREVAVKTSSTDKPAAKATTIREG